VRLTVISPGERTGRQLASWRKSSWSTYNGNCIEVGQLQKDLIGVRDTKDAGAGPVLLFSGEAWRSFIARVKDSERI
jgi:Domain of unknown function (DUF397)